MVPQGVFPYATYHRQQARVVASQYVTILFFTDNHFSFLMGECLVFFFCADLDYFHFVPAQHETSQNEIELELVLPPLSHTRIQIEFAKAFILPDFFPPDVSRGFDVCFPLLPP